MPNYSKKSQLKLAGCHADLQRIFMDPRLPFCTIIEGYRNKADQERYFREGKTKLHYPYGNHNQTPSRAVDVMPDPVEYPQDSDSKAEIARKLQKITLFARAVLAIAKDLGIKIRWGGDWNMDDNLTNDKWDDLPHFELV